MPFGESEAARLRGWGGLSRRHRILGRSCSDENVWRCRREGVYASVPASIGTRQRASIETQHVRDGSPRFGEQQEERRRLHQHRHRRPSIRESMRYYPKALRPTSKSSQRNTSIGFGRIPNEVWSFCDAGKKNTRRVVASLVLGGSTIRPRVKWDVDKGSKKDQTGNHLEKEVRENTSRCLFTTVHRVARSASRGNDEVFVSVGISVALHSRVDALPPVSISTR